MKLLCVSKELLFRTSFVTRSSTEGASTAEIFIILQHFFIRNFCAVYYMSGLLKHLINPFNKYEHVSEWRRK